ncbi:LysR family transcriptional regulator ArgP [Halotalea alkalilenta]|uniref:LysR family transcriptional regulator ArgP n=1 Tax=Halotalea alkalilenta TaxID=376489 RepID=UPI000486FBEF|nr:LysR family transcriptional regulator ArgP [Halotalea alkalilenta]
MIDYKLLEALSAVIDQGGFERGARALGLTQSAVSQRIKLLEARLGQPVLVRAPRLAPTETGQRLLNHVQQVRLLEYDLVDTLPALGEGGQRMRIVVNADSLATWWFEASGDFGRQHEVLFDLVIEDQDQALSRMRDGEVAACVCASPRAVQGARAHFLGGMRYLPVATPGFIGRYFADGIDEGTLSRAPAVIYGDDDRLQHRYLAEHGVTAAFPHHRCPSSPGFLAMVRNGLCYGLIPELQAREAIEAGELAVLEWETLIVVPLYWHHWRQGGQLLDTLTDHLLARAAQWLPEAEACAAQARRTP